MHAQESAQSIYKKPVVSLAHCISTPSFSSWSAEPEKLEEYLKRLSIRIVEQELDWNESTETLMWILLFGDETSDEALKQSVLVWWVGRMTNVAKRLSDNSWMLISKVMVSCLARETDEEGIFREDLQRWQEELMQAPLSWWPESVMPAIQDQ